MGSRPLSQDRLQTSILIGAEAEETIGALDESIRKSLKTYEKLGIRPARGRGARMRGASRGHRPIAVDAVFDFGSVRERTFPRT